MTGLQAPFEKQLCQQCDLKPTPMQFASFSWGKSLPSRWVVHMYLNIASVLLAHSGSGARRLQNGCMASHLYGLAVGLFVECLAGLRGYEAQRCNQPSLWPPPVPACQPVNIIGILTVCSREWLCKIINKPHDGPTESQGESVQGCFHLQLSKGQTQVAIGRWFAGLRAEGAALLRWWQEKLYWTTSQRRGHNMDRDNGFPSSLHFNLEGWWAQSNTLLPLYYCVSEKMTLIRPVHH